MPGEPGVSRGRIHNYICAEIYIMARNEIAFVMGCMKKYFVILFVVLLIFSTGCFTIQSARQPPVYNAPESSSSTSETLVLSKDLAWSDVPRSFATDWGTMTYDLAGGGTYHIIVKTTGTEDVTDVSIQYQEKWNVDKFGNVNYNPVSKYVGRADKFSDLDSKTTFPQDSRQQNILLVIKGQNGIISLKLYKVT
jgi:hypothetical protein